MSGSTRCRSMFQRKKTSNSHAGRDFDVTCTAGSLGGRKISSRRGVVRRSHTLFHILFPPSVSRPNVDRCMFCKHNRFASRARVQCLWLLSTKQSHHSSRPLHRWLRMATQLLSSTYWSPFTFRCNVTSKVSTAVCIKSSPVLLKLIFNPLIIGKNADHWCIHVTTWHSTHTM